jgi:hypothetical protein
MITTYAKWKEKNGAATPYYTMMTGELKTERLIPDELFQVTNRGISEKSGWQEGR